MKLPRGLVPLELKETGAVAELGGAEGHGSMTFSTNLLGRDHSQPRAWQVGLTKCSFHLQRLAACRFSCRQEDKTKSQGGKEMKEDSRGSDFFK